MNWFHLLTIIFVVAKLGGVLDWSWWLVLLPSLFSLGVGLIFLVLFLAALVIGMINKD
jgi:hypothetical protein